MRAGAKTTVSQPCATAANSGNGPSGSDDGPADEADSHHRRRAPNHRTKTKPRRRLCPLDKDALTDATGGATRDRDERTVVATVISGVRTGETSRHDAA